MYYLHKYVDKIDRQRDKAHNLCTYSNKWRNEKKYQKNLQIYMYCKVRGWHPKYSSQSQNSFLQFNKLNIDKPKKQ